MPHFDSFVRGGFRGFALVVGDHREVDCVLDFVLNKDEVSVRQSLFDIASCHSLVGGVDHFPEFGLDEINGTTGFRFVVS